MKRVDCGDGYVNVSFVYDELTRARHASAIRKLVDYLVRSEGTDHRLPVPKDGTSPCAPVSIHSRRAQRVSL